VLLKYLSMAARLIFGLWYFGVGVIGFITNDAVKDAATAATPLEKAMAESLFINPLLCLACLVGGGAMLFRRTAPLGMHGNSDAHLIHCGIMPYLHVRASATNSCAF
jgi:hypothetical protein